MLQTNKKFRVVQWATGNLGRAAIEGILSHPDLELVGVWVHSASKVGRDAGELSGHPETVTGITASNNMQDIIALQPDAVIYAPLLPVETEIVQLLQAGINVITPLGWFYPKGLKTDAIEQAAQSGAATLHGTGIHPGGMTEKLPLVLSGFSRAITQVSCEEFSDVRTYGAPDVLHHIMLFGKSREEAQKSSMLRFMGSGFTQSIRLVADAVGFALDEVTARHDIALATAVIASPMGDLQPGTVAAQRFTWEGMQAGKVAVTAAVNWYMGTEHIEAGWFDAAAIRSKGECYEMKVEGDPPVHVLLHGVHPSADIDWRIAAERNAGMVATAMHCVNSVPAVCRAAPGIKTYLDLELVTGKA
jgi:hypothetical protein